MNLFFIEKYIKKLQKKDIYNYAITQEIILTEQELDIIYMYIKTKYKIFLTNKQLHPQILSEIKKQLKPNTANKIDELYKLYKDKI